MRTLIPFSAALLLSTSALAADDVNNPCFGPGPCGEPEPVVSDFRHIKEVDCATAAELETEIRIYNPRGLILAGGRGVSQQEQCEAILCAVQYGTGCP